jgi:hypothetical protein
MKTQALFLGLVSADWANRLGDFAEMRGYSEDRAPSAGPGVNPV